MELLIKLGLDGDARFVGGHDDMALWPQLRQELSAIFATRDLAEWCEIFEGSDACWSPVLRPDEACDHPHLAARGSFVRVDGILQGAAAPRFSNTPSAPPEAPRLIGGDTRAVLTELGFGDAEIASLRDMQGHRT
jgi:alpha-methylacyl-CoA racemase